MLDVSNYYEQLVIDRLWKLNENAEKPLPRTFLEDVACLALNQLPPCYVRNTIDKGIHVSEQQYHDMMEAVNSAIEQAMEKVHRRPHDGRDI